MKNHSNDPRWERVGNGWLTTDPELVAEGVTRLQASKKSCDICGRRGRHTMARYELRYCTTCGRQLSLAQMLEHKYGWEYARGMLA